MKRKRLKDILRFGRLVQSVRGPSGQTLAASIASQALTVISGVIAARALGVEGRGTLALLWLLPLTIVLLGGIGIPQATTYYVARELGNAKAVVLTSVKISVFLAFALSSAYGGILLLVFGGGDDFAALEALLSAALIPMLLAQNLGVATLLGMRRYRAFNLSRVVPALMYTLTISTLFVSNHASLPWILGVTVGSWATGALITWSLVFRDMQTQGKRAGASPRNILSFGIRGVVGSASPIDDVRIDQLMIGLLMDSRALGLYVAALAFCNLPRFIAQSIGAVSFPRIAAARSGMVAWQIAERAFRNGVVLIALCVGTLLATIQFLLPMFFGNDFSDAVSIGQILLLAAFFLSVHRLLTELARGLGHPGYGSITEVVNLLVFLLAVLLIATPATTAGIATAVLVGGLASSTLLALLLGRLKKIQLGGRL